MGSKLITFYFNLSPEPKYEEKIRKKHTYTCTRTEKERERERDIERQNRNRQLKQPPDLLCQETTEAGIQSGELSWILCNQKKVSQLYIFTSREVLQILTQKFPHNEIYDLPTQKLWGMLEFAFIRPWHINSLSLIFLRRKLRRWHNHRCFLTETADDNLQRDLLRDTEEPKVTLSIVVNIEMGQRKQLGISSNKSISVNIAESYCQFCEGTYKSPTKKERPWNDSNCKTVGTFEPSIRTHKPLCIAVGKKCNFCGLCNHLRYREKQRSLTLNSSFNNYNMFLTKIHPMRMIKSDSDLSKISP